jgi:hypothetical protein
MLQKTPLSGHFQFGSFGTIKNHKIAFLAFGARLPANFYCRNRRTLIHPAELAQKTSE